MTDKKKSEANGTENGDKTERPEPTDDLVETTHQLGELTYKAVTGRIVLREEVTEDDKFEGHKAKAEVSITSYVLEGGDPAQRPVTFAFNGGPGSSSLWLHIGLLGPKRVVMGDAGALTPPPYGLTDNHETLLRHSDLVFIDPVSTGFSRAAAGEKAKDYHGFTGDLESVAEIIRLWTTRNNRWLSPKYLAGESYGGTRAGALADHLQLRYGMWLNGVILIAPALDMGSIRFHEGNDAPYANFLPTYAAIAHYHGLHEGRTLQDVMAEAREYALNEFPVVLSKGARLTAEERAAAVTKIASLTGLSEEYVDGVNLRIEHVRYYTELLRHRRLVVGRLDSRFTGPDSDYGREHYSSDPFFAAITGPYTAAFNHLVRAELGYESDLNYETLSRQVHPWSYSEFEGKQVTVVDKLSNAMRLNPHLRVYVGLGYYDGGVPPGAVEDSLAHLAIPDELRENIQVEYFEAGHMMYVHEESRLRQSQQLADFVTGTDA